MPKIYPSVDEAKTILETASEYTGWNTATMFDVICDYVNCHHGTAQLLEYVQDLVDEEYVPDQEDEEDDADLS